MDAVNRPAGSVHSEMVERSARQHRQDVVATRVWVLQDVQAAADLVAHAQMALYRLISELADPTVQGSVGPDLDSLLNAAARDLRLTGAVVAAMDGWA